MADVSAWVCAVTPPPDAVGKVDVNNTNQGLTPIGLLGPVDQHSFLQLIVEGQRDKTVTFIKIKDFKDNTSVILIDIDDFKSFNTKYGYGEADLILKKLGELLGSDKRATHTIVKTIFFIFILG